MIASLRLQHFRSFSDASFEFESGVNIIIGPNASGKTNLLESILVVAQGSSYRSADKDLIQLNKEWARLDVATDGNTRHSVVIKRRGESETAQKQFTIDGTDYKRLQRHHKIPVVIFEPNQLLYLASSPELRRNLLDGLLEQLDVQFASHKRAYNRTLTQRNALLKTGGAKNKLFAWDIRLSELAGSIVQARCHIIKTLNDSIEHTYSELAGSLHTVRILYESRTDLNNYAASMLKQLQAAADKDLERGFTSIGPHRDDLAILINKASLQSFASRGETRTVLLAIKVQEALLLEEKYNQKALMLLDDVFGELDGKRRTALTRFLQTHQAFITTTDADVIQKNYAKTSLLINLAKDD